MECIETIIAEKLHALIFHGDQNSRSKDVYDLAFFLPNADSQILQVALKRCFEFRETNLPDSLTKAIETLSTARLEKGWASAVSSITEAIPFKNAFRRVVSEICRIEKVWIKY